MAYATYCNTRKRRILPTPFIYMFRLLLTFSTVYIPPQFQPVGF